MIVVTENTGKIIIEGHAGYAPHGQDIVCAAVSALTQVFIASVSKLTTDNINASTAAGKAVIEYGTLTEGAQLLLRSFFLGVQMIAEEYPNNVKIVQAWKTK